MSLKTWIGDLFGAGNINNEMSSDDLQRLLMHGLYQASAAGVTVTPKNAMQLSAAYASVRVISESVAILPFNVYKKTDNGGREIAEDHPIQKLLGPHGVPNSWQDTFEYFETATRHCATRGNHYAFINRVGTEIRELVLLHPGTMTVEQGPTFELIYTHTPNGGPQRKYKQSEILHLRGPGDSGFYGDDLIVQQRESLGLGIAQDKFAAKLFANGARFSGVLEHPGKLSENALKNLSESFSATYSGVENAHKVAIIEEGMKFTNNSMTSDEAQLLESRKLQRSMVAAFWRVPPHMINDLEKSTFSNIENMARQFVDYALMPWLLRWERGIERQLLTEDERGNLFVKFNVSGLLRGDAKTRADFYSKLIAARVMSPNEAREKEDLPPYEGGDEFKNPNIEPETGDPDEKPTDTDDDSNVDDEPGKKEPGNIARIG